MLTLKEELAAFFEVLNDMRRNQRRVAVRLDTAATQLAQEFAHEFAQESDFEKSLMVRIAQLTGLQYDSGEKRVLVVEDCGFKVEIRQQITASTACFESLPVTLAIVPKASSDIGLLLTHNKFGTRVISVAGRGRVEGRQRSNRRTCENGKGATCADRCVPFRMAGALHGKFAIAS